MRSKILDKRTQDTIIDYISKGNYIKTACLAAGVCESTFWNWNHRAENGEQDYIDFLEPIKKAREQSVVSNVSLIQEAAKKPQNWPAAAWLLERTRPDDYAKREPAIIVESKVLIALQDRFQALRSIDVAQQTLCDSPKVIEGESKLISEGEGDSGGEGD